MKINLFVPAAGLGERLRPITDHIPKPLLPILGRPAIEGVIERTSVLPVEKIGINTHYMADKIKNWAEKSIFSARIELFYEKKILGTGGALKNASRTLKESVFMVHNSDIITDMDFCGLLDFHISAGNMVTLAVHDHPDFSNVWVDEEGKIRYIGKQTDPGFMAGHRKKAFTGVAVYSPEFLDLLPDGQSSVVTAWLDAAALGQRVMSMDVTGCLWTDIGTPASYATAVFDALKRTGETAYIGPSVECSTIKAGQSAVIEEGSNVGANSSIKRAILLPGCRVSDGEALENCIIGPDFSVRIPDEIHSDHYILDGANPLLLKYFMPGKATSELIGAGGSDRKYYRIKEDDKKMVLMMTGASAGDFEKQIEYTRFFQKAAIPVPILIDSDFKTKQALFEDLGDISLYTWLKCKRDEVQIKEMYKKVIDVLVLIHTGLLSAINRCPLLGSTIFDYDHLRWETDYFLERYVKGIKGIDIEKDDPVMEDLQRLAHRVDSIAKTVIHRDFQSQNIMIIDGSKPRVIDYQGARMGPAAYDLASILFDPYYRLEDDTRLELIDHYMKKRKDVEGLQFDEGMFRAGIVPCCLQRHMQALGAYGYLSKVKGKRYFLKYAPQALSYLTYETCEVRDEYRALYKLVASLNETP